MNKQRVLQALEYVKSNPYGKWGILNIEQRRFIKELCNSWLILDEATNMQTKEIERLKKELEIEKDISDGMLETIDKAIDYIEKPISLIYKKDCGRQFKKILEILKKEENNESSNIDREIN